MKKTISFVVLPVLASAVFAVQAVASDAVACMGKVVPGDRIAKLTANSPTGAQVVIKQIFVKKGENGAPESAKEARFIQHEMYPEI